MNLVEMYVKNPPPFSYLCLVLAELEPQPRYIEDSMERVVGGEVAPPNSWPWQVITPTTP